MQNNLENSRYYGLDWVRVIAFSLLIFYHTGMFFVTWDFHFKNSETSESMELWMLFLNQWRLPLLFFISGAGVCFALKKRTGWQFTQERFIRLFVPLLFGMLVVVPPQIYFERLYKHQFSGSYFDFYPSVFQFVPYPSGGSLSWHHLWFVLYLFVYCLVWLPLFLFLKSEKGQHFTQKIAGFLGGKVTIYLLFLPIWLCYVFLSNKFPVDHGLFNDWFAHAFYSIVFIYGYVLASDNQLLAIIENTRKISLTLGLICFLVMLVGFFMPNRDYIPWIPHTDNSPEFGTAFFIFRTLKSLNLWCWMLAIVGFGLKYLNFSTPFLKYANEAVYPFYILHQTVMISIGYYVVQWNLGLVPKFFIIAVGMFGITWVLYEFLVRRNNLTRLLFGLRPFPKKQSEVKNQVLKEA